MRRSWLCLGALLLVSSVPAAAELPMSDSPAPVNDRTTLEQRTMTLPELDDFFETLKVGTAMRLTFVNGAEYAGNFERKVSGKSVVVCRSGLLSRRQVSLATVKQAYFLLSSTDTLRIRRADLRWSEK
jgi:hypothetical protein